MSSTVTTAADSAPSRTLSGRLRSYFFSDIPRSTQTLLGLIWCLDGGLQFQSFMYSHGFIALLKGQAIGQPSWLHHSVIWGANIAASNTSLWNTLFAVTQCLIGLGLLYRPLVKPAIVCSFAWVLIVWWFGEAFGMMLMATTSIGGVAMASPLTGAPGAVLLYGIVGALAWPGARPGGLLGVRGARTVWAGLWLVMAWLWLVEGGGPNGIHNEINAAPSGMSWLSSMQDGFASVTKGNGVIFSFLLAALSAAIAIAVARNWRAKEFLFIAGGLSLLYWLVGQGFGGIFQGGATDVNSGPLFMLLALVMLPVAAVGAPVREQTRSASSTREEDSEVPTGASVPA